MAESTGATDAGEPDDHYHWPRPPEGGWTADDLDRLPGLPPHTELLDGSLVFTAPHTRFHQRVLRLLEYSLLGQVPDGLEVIQRMTIRLDSRSRPDPDVLVYRSEADLGPDQTWYEPEHVVIAVEAVSADSVDRDREVKPRKYAKAGIPYHWRVEESDGRPVVYAYELDPATQSYGLIGIFHDKLVLSVPFPIEIDLTAVNRRPAAPPSV